MDSPGISVRPIVSLSGEHEVNQVFFDNVRVPVDQRVGAENEGWTVTKRMLEYERGGLIYSAMAMSLLHEAQAIAEAQPGDEAPTLSQDVTFRLRAAELEIDILAQSAGEEQMAAAIARGERIGDAAAAIQKIAGTETMQAAAELCADALGRYAIADQRACLYGAEDAAPIGPDYAARPVAKYLNSRASSIYAGTNEILRTLIARTALGLRS
jgi:alkylation response protein AidB-like acyl-CoA dehydrogenase